MPSKKTNQDRIIKFSCERVNLLLSNYSQEEVSESTNQAKLDIGIEVDIHDNGFVSRLHVTENFISAIDENNKVCHRLSFCLAGYFACADQSTKEDIKLVGQLHSLSILWPYAREYSSDVFRRIGCAYPILPIINPQDLTQKLIENNEIKVNELLE